MKTKILLSVLMIVMIVGTFAQKPTMTLTFTADNIGQHVPLSSILIENLTHSGDTTLYAPDTVLVLSYLIGIEEGRGFREHGFSLSQNFPNPMEGKTTIELLMHERENTLITISDIWGREEIRQEFQLAKGTHSFTFYPGREPIYFLTVRANDRIRTMKMFHDLSCYSGIAKLEYQGAQNNTGYKSGNDMHQFVFERGDLLRFTSFTNLGERVITSAPMADQTYYFHYAGEPCYGIPTATDVDGNVYNTVQIGTQCWMKENLKTTTYSNGTPIPNVTDAVAWSNLTSGAYGWYDNEILWKDKYGALYNWFTTVDPNGLCPTGWHVPTYAEWRDLIEYIGASGQPQGNELKSCRQVNSPLGGGCNTTEHPRWEEDGLNGNYGTDNYGFSGLPGGYRFSDGFFKDLGYDVNWWTSTEAYSGNAWYRYLSYSDGYVSEYSATEQMGFSVRCLKD